MTGATHDRQHTEDDATIARLFVAVRPDPTVVAALQELPRVDAPGVRWVPPEQWHVTLRFIGDAPVDCVVDRITGARLPAARLAFGPRVDLLGDRVLVVPVDGADELAAAVRDATAGFGADDSRVFRGHLTLARFDRGRTPALLGAPVSAEQSIDEVVVVRSRPHGDGHTHTDIATHRVG